jgi:tripartite-type tricarboxylate transporter receptor subunit TctC
MPIMRKFLTASVLSALLMPSPGGEAVAQTYPTKAVTLVVPYSAGGTADVVARVVGQALSPVLGKAVVVDNRAGGGGVIGWGNVARAAPDGYTLLAAETSLAIAAGLIPKLPFDPRKSFTHVVTAAAVPQVLVVNPSVQANTVQELIALAKASPGKLFYGSGGNGTNTHLAAELFKNVTGTDITHVPYKGAGAALTDVVSGQVQMLVTSLPTALPFLKSGKLKALMVTSEQRAPVLPDVPSAVEAGVPEVNVKYWVGLAVPAGTPQDIVDKLNRDTIAALAQEDTKKRLADLGVEPVGNTPAEAAKLVNDEIDRWSAVIKAAGIKPD